MAANDCNALVRAQEIGGGFNPAGAHSAVTVDELHELAVREEAEKGRKSLVSSASGRQLNRGIDTDDEGTMICRDFSACVCRSGVGVNNVTAMFLDGGKAIGKRPGFITSDDYDPDLCHRLCRRIQVADPRE
jgi:hypothetical protein